MNDRITTSGTLNYTFGAVSIAISAEGANIDRPTEMIDHMLSTATAISGIEIVNSGISHQRRDDSAGSTHEKYAQQITFGDKITVSIEIKFDLAGHVSKRTLNSIVFGGILPKTVQTAAIYFGDNRTLTSPPSPLPSRLRRDVYADADKALALFVSEDMLTTAGSHPESHQTDSNSSR